MSHNPNKRPIVKPWVVESLRQSINDWLNKLADGKCLHDKCWNCNGTGINKYTGQPCVHMIGCRCVKCSPQIN